MTEPHRSQEQKRAFPLAFVLLALVLRLVYVPVHLAHEEHLGAGALHPPSHHSEHGEHAEGGHDHEDGHPPHHEADHTGELIADRAPSQQAIIVLAALPPAEAWSLLAPVEAPRVLEPEPRLPKRPPPRARWARGPPVAA